MELTNMKQPTQTEQLHYIHRIYLAEIEKGKVATSGPWTQDYLYVDNTAGMVLKCGSKRTVEDEDASNATFIASIRTSGPCALESLIIAIDALEYLSQLGGGRSQGNGDAEWALKRIITRHENSYGEITNAQIESK